MRFLFRLFVLILGVSGVLAAQAPAPPAPAAPLVDPDALFRNPDASPDARLADLVSRLTPDEKIAALSTNLVVPRLGIPGARLVEGLHGLAYGGPSNWGSRNPMPTTIFPQAVGLGETWDVDAVRRVGRIEGSEARFIFQSPRWNRGGLVILAPNADLARDPRWGRTEESYGEDPFLTGSLAAAMVHGLQGDDPKYWQAASLMKHLLANSNENGRSSSSSDFDERLLREYYSVPFRMGVVEGGAKAFMAAYNKVNGIPCMVQPFLREMTMKDWGLDGIICTDGGALGLLISAHHQYPTLEEGAAATIKAGITVFLDRYPDAVRTALDKGLLAWSDIDAALVRNFRVALKLGLLDPPDRVPYAAIGKTGEDPWLDQSRHDEVRQVTRESIVLLKNANHTLPIDPAKVRSIAVIGPRATSVLPDWYSGTPPYTVSPLDGIREAAGDRVKVWFAADNAAGAAAALAKQADLAIVIVGNHPTCNAGWEQCPVASDGKEAVDRKAHRPRAGSARARGLRGQQAHRDGPEGQLSVRDQLERRARAGHPDDGAQQPGGRARAGRRPLRRVQPGRSPGAHVAEVGDATAADDGLRHPARTDVHVREGPAVSVRLRPELHDVSLRHAFGAGRARGSDGGCGRRRRGDERRHA